MTQFDATARINVDLSGFARAASQSTSAGGAFTASVRSLQTALTQVEGVNKRTTGQLMNALNLYKQLASTVNTYASAVSRLAEGNNRSAVNQRRLNSALDALSGSLARVTGLTKEETAAKSRELRLYQQLASAINQYASALQKMASVQQRSTQLSQQQAAANQRAQLAAQRLTQQQQALAQAEARLQLQQQRLAQQAIAMANAQDRANRAAQQGSNSFTSFSSSTFALRSSVGELEQGFQRLAKILVSIPTAIASAAISQEQAFAQVARVVGEAEAASAGLLERFREIAQTSPISFEEVARIGQLGSQIGIAANELGDFTDTVVRFSITTGVAADEATLLLGRIAEMQNVPITEMENLGSAILALGTASAATDREILRVNESIATASNIFGLTVEATSGLAAALATLRVRPELARGSLTRVFGQLRDAVEQGGDSLTRLSEIMGITAEAAVELFQTDTDKFFLSFIEGLQNAAANGESFRNVLADLGIGAVRDIDTISRLGNNFDVLAESTDRAFVEYAKGSELQRQSKTIYETTANEIQNLNDAFKSFLAIAGAPIAKAINTIAKVLTEVVELAAQLGPIVPILGLIAGGVAAGTAAWAAMQVILAKTLQSIIAMRELQRNLGVQTISLNTVIAAWRGNLIGAAQGAAALNAAQRSLSVSTSALSATLAASVASTGRIAAANTAAALTTTQLATRQAQAVGQTSLLTASQSGLNASLVRSVPALTSMSAAMQRAVASGVALTNTNAALTASQARVAAGGVAAAAATTQAGLAARAASFAFGPWGIAIGTAALLLGGLVGGMADFRSGAEKTYDAALQQAGGIDALTNAIKADTEAAKEGGRVYRSVAVTKDDVSAADRRSAAAARDSAKARITEIELVAGSISELRKQANAHDTGAKAAQRYVAEIEDEEQKIAEANKVLKENVAIIGEQTRAWLLNTAEAAANASGLSKNAEALEKLKASGVDVGDVLTKALTDPQAASEDLSVGIDKLQGLINDDRALQGSRKVGTYSESLEDTIDNTQTAQEFLEALNKAVQEQGDEAAKTATIQELLGKALDDTGESAEATGGKVKLTKDNLADLGVSAEDAQTAIDALSEHLAGFGTAFDAFTTAAEAAAGEVKSGTDEAAAAVENFSLKTKAGFDAYLKELEKIATAQRNWATNLIKISATLGPGIAAELQKLGPEAAPFIEELANLTSDELKKLKPRLEAIMGDNIDGLAASIIKGQGKIKNASASTANVIGATLAAELGSAKNTAQFNAVIDRYGVLLKNIEKHKGEIKIDNDAAFDSIDALIQYIKLVEERDELTANGESEMSSTAFIEALKRLNAEIERLEKGGAFDPDGKAKLDQSSFNGSLGNLRDGVYRYENRGWLDPDGKAKLNTGTFYTQLANLRTNSRSTGQTIQANLTRTATVTVGYTYVQNNRPPATAQVKDGGWISGPGGPRDDKVPAMLSNGEFVVNARAARRYAGILENINSFRGAGGAQSMEVTGKGDQASSRFGELLAASRGQRGGGARVPERASALAAQGGTLRRGGPTINITNNYPLAEPTSKTVNRALAFAAALDGTT